MGTRWRHPPSVQRAVALTKPLAALKGATNGYTQSQKAAQGGTRHQANARHAPLKPKELCEKAVSTTSQGGFLRPLRNMSAELSENP
ncbi:MAG: hypothetical protein Unbinned5179contig1001_28 [Prokaryotic dsDNA virus sp.]|nr:MAG: hypothetical protein Unbinned5179contig1001_28 [Prokaryotic dsDNA virus sp.]